MNSLNLPTNFNNPSSISAIKELEINSNLKSNDIKDNEDCSSVINIKYSNNGNISKDYKYRKKNKVCCLFDCF